MLAGLLAGLPPLDLSPAGFARVLPPEGGQKGALVEFYDPEEAAR